LPAGPNLGGGKESAEEALDLLAMVERNDAIHGAHLPVSNGLAPGLQ
jgi:hypothetical protein